MHGLLLSIIVTPTRGSKEKTKKVEKTENWGLTIGRWGGIITKLSRTAVHKRGKVVEKLLKNLLTSEKGCAKIQLTLETTKAACTL